MIYPWLTNIWQTLISAVQANRLPHALLLTGMQGVGKLAFTHSFARACLCQRYPLSNTQLSHDQCDCHACQLVLGGVHPNVYSLTPEKEGQPIKVDAIREGCDFIAQTSVSNGYRFLIIHPANRMNINAANALLKTLEEPPGDAMIILVSDQDAYLPATIKSRCHRVQIPKPDHELALTWLKAQLDDNDHRAELLLSLAHGAPLTALAMADGDVCASRQAFYKVLSDFCVSHASVNPIRAAETCQSLDVILLLDWLMSFIMDVMRYQAHESVTLSNVDQKQTIVALSKQSSTDALSTYLSLIQHYRKKMLSGVNLNKTILMEHLFIQLKESML